MEVILQDDVTHLGHVGEVVKVRDGYARNYLFPRGLAVLADKRNVRELEHQRRVVEGKRQRIAASAQEVAKRLSALQLTFTARAGDGGKLFGSITNQDIERELRDKGFEIDRRRVRLDEPIKSVGSHKVTVLLAAGVPCEVTVLVSAIANGDVTADGASDTTHADSRGEAESTDSDA